MNVRGMGRLKALYQVLANSNVAGALSNLTYSGDGINTSHHIDFLNDPKFLLAQQEALMGTSVSQKLMESIAWRCHIATWAAERAVASSQGDIVECGVWHGLLSRTWMSYVGFEKFATKAWLVDPWGGVGSPAKYEEDLWDSVQNAYSKYPNVRLIRGTVPDALRFVEATEVAYLALDMNSGLAERLALDFFWDKLIPGAVIYLDDWGWEYPQLREEISDFLRDKSEKLLHFPTGNSIIIKE